MKEKGGGWVDRRWGCPLPINTHTHTPKRKRKKKPHRPVVEGKAPVRVKHGDRGKHMLRRGGGDPRDKENRGLRSVAFI